MKLIITLLTLVPFVVWADGRIELGDQNATGHNCHVPWSTEDADLEFKNYCEASSTQHDDGTYTAQATMVYLNRVPELVDAPVDLSGGWDMTETNCEVTACTFQNDGGTAFTTNKGSMVIIYTPSVAIPGRIDILAEIVLHRAALPDKAGLEASELAGMSKAARVEFMRAAE